MLLCTRPGRKGSRPGKKANINRNIAKGAVSIFEDYFADNPVYPEEICARRYRMGSNLFRKICQDILSVDKFFEQRRDCTGLLGGFLYQKATVAMRLLAYGCCADSLDEYTRYSESMALDCLEHICTAVINKYEYIYLRSPTQEDAEELCRSNARRGFPGLLGSLDCMHWRWKQCPKAWHGHYKGKEEGPTVVLEAIATKDLYIWHCFFGYAGMCFNTIWIISKISPFKCSNFF